MAGGKRANGEGAITYDRTRKRYRARVTIGWEYNEETGRTKQIVKSIGSNFKTKGEASRALAEYLDNPYDISHKDMTFQELYDVWFPEFVVKHEKSKYKIMSGYRYCSSIYKKKMRNITIRDMKNCIENGTAPALQGKYKGQMLKASPSTKKSMKYLFNHMWDFANEARIVERNYAKEFHLEDSVEKDILANRKIKQPFNQKELDKMWDAINYIPFLDMIIYACYSGWRPGELVQLKLEDVNLEEEYIVGGIKTESGRNRIVPIHPIVMPIVKKYYDQAIQYHSEYLFNDVKIKTGLGLSYDQYVKRFKDIMKALNLREEFSDEITPHYTRHTFISKAKGRDVKMDEYVLKLIVGHKIKDITENVYTHRSIDDLKEEMLKIKE